MEYRNFVLYRGGGSPASYFARDFKAVALKNEAAIGKTYYSLIVDNKEEKRNFLTDPEKYMGKTENVILLLTSNFFEGFIKDGKPNPESVTRVEINEALKNENNRFILIYWPDFSWHQEIDGLSNQEIVSTLWGEAALKRIKGSSSYTEFHDISYQDEVFNKIITMLTPYSTINIEHKLVSSIDIKQGIIFHGREKELEQLDYLLSENRVVFLQGIGGIGKTKIVDQYVKQCQRPNNKLYDTVIFATYNGSIMDLVVSKHSPFRIKPEFPKIQKADGTIETDLDYFYRKLDEIKEIANERTLIIVDHYDVFYDKHFNDLLDNAYYKMIFTTRCDNSTKFPIIKVEPLESMETLRKIFIDYYGNGDFVKEDDPKLDELIELVNRHTYTIELIAQYMEYNPITTEKMIDILKTQGIISLNNSVNSESYETEVVYENLKKMFKVLDLNEEDKYVLSILSLMPLSGIKPSDFVDWLGNKNYAVCKSLEKRSWVVSNDNGIALHPVVRDIVRNELNVSLDTAKSFLAAFNETIKEEKSWHYPIDLKCYLGDIGLELINYFKELNEDTLELYKNVEVILSFEVKPAKAVELCDLLFNYYSNKLGENSFMCAYYSFQAGWTYLFNLFLPEAFIKAEKWFDISFKIFKNIELSTETEFAVYGHLLTHMARVFLIYFGFKKDNNYLELAKQYALEALNNAITHFKKDSPFYSRIAVADMQLAEVYIADKKYEKSLELLNESYDIVVSMYGADDPDSINVLCRITSVQLYLERYEEALELGKKNLAAYTRYYGELNPLRFEQLLIVYKSSCKVGDPIETEKYKEDILKVGSQLLEEDSPILEELVSNQ